MGQQNRSNEAQSKQVGRTLACRSVQLMNIGHLTTLTYRNRINDDGGLFAMEMSGHAGGTTLVLPIMRMEMGDTNLMKICINEPCSL